MRLENEISTRYIRGYLLCRTDDAPVPDHWGTWPLPAGWTLYADTRLNVQLYRFEGMVVGFLGDVLADSSEPAILPAVAGRLAKVMNSDAPQMERIVSRLAGRFVAFTVSNSAEVRVQQSGTALRSVFWATDGTAVSGHENLSAEAADRRGDPDFDISTLRELGLSYAPGARTAWSEVRRLTANTELKIDGSSATIRRVVEEVPEPLQADEAADILVASFEAQLDSLFRRYETAIVPLTAGLDSRASLAVLSPYWSRCKFFTYQMTKSARSDFVRSDVETGGMIARAIGVDRTVVAVGEDQRSTSTAVTMKQNNSRPSTTLVAWHLRKQFPKVPLHLVSSAFEIGNAHYLGRRRPPMDAVSMAGLIVRPGGSISDRAVNGFEEFIAETSFPLEGDWISPYERFYWEHRVSVWGSSVALDFDWAQETLTLMSSRTLAHAMLAVSHEEKRSKAVQRAIIRRASPELLSFPINQRG